jgi:hypothetical protein
MDDLFNLQLLQQQQHQQSQKMFPPMARRSSLLACMDEDGNIDPVRYIQHSKMKRANFLYHMNNLFPGSSAAIPSSNSNSSAMMNRMMMASMMNNSNNGMMTNGFGNTGMAGLPTSMGVARRSSFPMNFPTRHNTMDFSRTGVVPPRMFGSMGMGSSGMNLDRIMLGNSDMISGTFSLATSPTMKPTPAMIAAAAGTLGRSQQQPQNQAAVLNQDEYDAAEALLFGMGRACPSNKNVEGRNDEETTSGKGNRKKKAARKKAGTPKKRKVKATTSLKKKTTTKKKVDADVAIEGDDEARSQPPAKKRSKILELYPECFS